MATKPDSSQKFKLIKRSLEIQQQRLSAKIFELNQQLSKKELSVRVFESYFLEYNKDLEAKPAATVVNFMNQQRFLNQIAAVLLKEREGLQTLQLKKSNLLKEFAEVAQKVDVISENIDIVKKNKIASNEKKVENINQELFENFAKMRTELFDKK